jgi:organic hydroperoxide reductase OsmC/OhrA
MTEVPYEVTTTWTGTRPLAGVDFDRSNELTIEGQPPIPGGSDRWSPEHLLIGAVSQCTMLWFLHLCAKARIAVESYVDHARGTLTIEGSRGQVTDVVLDVTVDAPGADAQRVQTLFDKAVELCFIGRTLNIDIRHQLTVS